MGRRWSNGAADEIFSPNGVTNNKELSCLRTHPDTEWWGGCNDSLFFFQAGAGFKDILLHVFILLMMGSAKRHHPRPSPLCFLLYSPPRHFITCCGMNLECSLSNCCPYLLKTFIQQFYRSREQPLGSLGSFLIFTLYTQPIQSSIDSASEIT